MDDDCAGLRCSSSTGAGEVSVTCNATRPLAFPSECVLSGPDTEVTFACESALKCNLLPVLSVPPPRVHAGNASDIVLDVGSYPPGEYNLTVRVQDENGLNTTTVLESLPVTGTARLPPGF